MEERHIESTQIRKGTLEDLDGLSKLCAETFYESYYRENTAEDMRSYINNHFNPDHIAAELKNNDITIFIAFQGQKMIGYIKLEKINSSYMPEGKGCEVSRFYVVKEYQHLKVGSKLMNIANKFAFDNKCSYLWLGVWQKNERAQTIYKHLGFRIAGNTTFTLGSDVQHDYVMIKPLKNENFYTDSNAE